MRRSIVLFTVVSIFLFSCGFIDPDTPIYDPEKAGATIVESFNITGQIKFFNASFNKNELICGYYNMALNGDKIYIHTGGKVLYVFERNSFTKTGEINLKKNWFSFDIFYRNGLAIIDEGHGFLVCEILNVPKERLLLLDLITGNVSEIEDLEEIGIEPTSWIKEIGYDKENNFIWFNAPLAYSGKDNIYFFEYNSLEGIFTLNSRIELINSKFMLNLGNIFISGDNLFRIGYGHNGSTPYEKTDIGVEKYHIDNTEERLYFINAEYLGTKTIPQHIIYDEPYIWMMVERDNQIQMLKLLPNE